MASSSHQAGPFCVVFSSPPCGQTSTSFVCTPRMLGIRLSIALRYHTFVETVVPGCNSVPRPSLFSFPCLRTRMYLRSTWLSGALSYVPLLPPPLTRSPLPPRVFVAPFSLLLPLHSTWPYLYLCASLPAARHDLNVRPRPSVEVLLDLAPVH